MNTDEVTSKAQGMALSILLALGITVSIKYPNYSLSGPYRAISIAPALQGEFHVCSRVGWAALGSWSIKSDGTSVGDENESRYSAMKKSSFSAHTVKRTY